MLTLLYLKCLYFKDVFSLKFKSQSLGRFIQIMIVLHIFQQNNQQKPIPAKSSVMLYPLEQHFLDGYNNPHE